MNDEEAIENLVRLGEAAYDRMYDARSSSGTSAEYHDAKDYFTEAIALARARGLVGRAAELEKRLEHIKAVFRHQFT